MPIGSKGRIAMFEYQPPAVLNQPNPVQNTWYDILPETPHVRVYVVSINIEDTDETLQTQVLIDGEVVAGTDLPATQSIDYYAIAHPSAINRIDRVGHTTWAGYSAALPAFIWEGHLVQVQVRKTTANGVGNLTGIVCWGQLLDVP